MLDPSHKDLRRNGLLTKSLYRAFVSSAVMRIQHRDQLPDGELADRIGASDGTISNARNQNNNLCAITLFNLLLADDRAIESLLHHFGLRSVPIEANCDTDAMVPLARLMHNLAVCFTEASDDPKSLTENDCMRLEADVDDVVRKAEAIKARCLKIHAARAAA